MQALKGVLCTHPGGRAGRFHLGSDSGDWDLRVSPPITSASEFAVSSRTRWIIGAIRAFAQNRKINLVGLGGGRFFGFLMGNLILKGKRNSVLSLRGYFMRHRWYTLGVFVHGGVMRSPPFTRVIWNETNSSPRAVKGQRSLSFSK